MARLFGTDGVRGVANQNLTSQLAFALGQGGAQVLINHRKDNEGDTNSSKSETPLIIIGKDTRLSGDMLEAAVAAGLCSAGAKVVTLGVAPTPAVSYLVKAMNADAGVVISASHNPMEYNGIKFFSNSGFKLSDSLEDEIEKCVKAPENVVPAKPEAIGTIHHQPEVIESYVTHLLSTIPTSLKGLRVALDCANGAVSGIAAGAFEKAGATVSVINNSPDGCNINANCGSTHMGGLIEFVKANPVDIGFAFDGDADRVLAVDENGEFVDGDKIMLIIAGHMKRIGTLKDNTIVATVMSNLGMFIAAKELGFNIAVTAVGDRYVLEEMLAKGYNIGGEQSGHIILTDHAATGDGLLTALQLTRIVRETQPLSELARVMTVYPQILVNAKVSSSKVAYEEVPEIAEEIAKINAKFGGEGRVLIRPSGTEPLIRVMLEGKDMDAMKQSANALAALIEKHFPAK